VKIKIIGSAAGGGFPQWNCNAPLSRAVRSNWTGYLPRKQSSIAASVDDQNWVVFNASPDIRQQIADTPELHPREDGSLRNTPIAAVVLTNADVDHIAGLLSLRERQQFILYGTDRVLKTLEENSIFQVLNSEVVERRELPHRGICEVQGPGGATGITIETFPVPGKVALFLEDENAEGGNFGTQEGDTIGVRISERNGGANLFYIPGCARIDGDLKTRLMNAECLLFDGTVFVDTEMQDTGVGEKTGGRMGHMAISGPQGTLAALSDVDIARRIFVHINNTNPILEPGSEAERQVLAAGWEIGYDGMEVHL